MNGRSLLRTTALVALVLAMPALVHAQTLGRIDDNVLEVDGQLYPFGHAAFGPLFDQTGISGELQLVSGGVYGGCTTIKDDLTGKIALIYRGLGICRFDLKVHNAEVAGARAVIILNTVPAQLPFMQPTIAAGLNGPAITIPSGMMALVDAAQVRNLTSTAVARKVAPEEFGRVLNGWLDSFGMLSKNDQFVELYFWLFDLDDLGVLRSSHVTAMTNKISAAYKQYFKGNLGAFDTKLTDFVVQVRDLESKGQVEAPFSDSLVGAAELIRIEDGT